MWIKNKKVSGMEYLEGNASKYNALLLQVPLVESPLVESNLGSVNIQMNYHSDIPLWSLHLKLFLIGSVETSIARSFRNSSY